MPGNQTGTDMRPNTGAYENSDVIDKVSQRLEQFEESSSTPIPTKSPAEPKDSTPAEPGVEPAESDDSTPGDLETEPADGTQTKDEKPPIPDNYYRAAIHQGWEPEQIDKLYKTDPEGTLKFLEKSYDAVNNLSQQFAQLGRKARELESQTAIQAQSQVQTSVQPQSLIDMDKFQKAYEDDPGKALAAALNEGLQKLSQVKTEPVQQVQQGGIDTDQLAAVEEMNTFFGLEDMKPYAEFYGNSKSLFWDDITPGQIANRYAIVNRADEILAGAELLGTGMSVREAIERAHLEVAAPLLKEVIRGELVSQVKKRAKGTTLRPSKSKSIPAPSGGKLSDEQVHANAAERLRELRRKGL